MKKMLAEFVKTNTDRYNVPSNAALWNLIDFINENGLDPFEYEDSEAGTKLAVRAQQDEDSLEWEWNNNIVVRWEESGREFGCDGEQERYALHVFEDIKTVVLEEQKYYSCVESGKLETQEYYDIHAISFDGLREFFK